METRQIIIEDMGKKDFAPECGKPKKSMVKVEIVDAKVWVICYNDQFDLREGDFVYVDGIYAGQRGIVSEVFYNFKIDPADYCRVVFVADRAMHGCFYASKKHFITFDREAMPRSKATLWFLKPKDNSNIVCSTDESSFPLSNLDMMGVSRETAELGYEYNSMRKVRYMCVDGDRGYAIVKRDGTYEVEFRYSGGEISELVCSCTRFESCEHEVAVMLHLKDILEIIEKNYSDEYTRSGYFAAIYKEMVLQQLRKEENIRCIM